MAEGEIGSIALISNLLRELFAFALIPIIAKYLHNYTCTAPAGATSQDTSLTMLIKYTSPTIVALAVFDGIYVQ